MYIFNSITDYLLEASIGDKIILKDLLNPVYKINTYTVVDIFNGSITVKMYRSKTRVIIDKDQPVRRLSKEEFKTLK